MFLPHPNPSLLGEGLKDIQIGFYTPLLLKEKGSGDEVIIKD
jgi:hypothetical protein